jgi:hypothetical protein
MQGKERADRQLLDAQALVGHLVPAGSMFAFLAAHRAEVFPSNFVASLPYSATVSHYMLLMEYFGTIPVRNPV